MRVSVSAPALLQVLQALLGPPHHIRELQATRNLPGIANPINTLLEEYKAAVVARNPAPNTVGDVGHAEA